MAEHSEAKLKPWKGRPSGDLTDLPIICLRKGDHLETGLICQSFAFGKYWLCMAIMHILDKSVSVYAINMRLKHFYAFN